MTPENVATLGETLVAVASAIGLPAITAAVIYALLNRRGANKKLSLDERTVGVSEFDKQLGAYQDLLNRANVSLAEAVAKIIPLEKRVSDLERADEAKSDELDQANTKIELLRKLFTSYLNRTGVPLTPEEQDVFDRTIPSPKLRATG